MGFKSALEQLEDQLIPDRRATMLLTRISSNSPEVTHRHWHFPKLVDRQPSLVPRVVIGQTCILPPSSSEPGSQLGEADRFN